jgi:hypothetical protein
MNGSTAKTNDVTVMIEKGGWLALGTSTAEQLRGDLALLEGIRDEEDGARLANAGDAIESILDLEEDLVTVSEAIGNEQADARDRHERALLRLADRLGAIRKGLHALDRAEKVQMIRARLAVLCAAPASKLAKRSR